jgi:hypothetical protein
MKRQTVLLIVIVVLAVAGFLIAYYSGAISQRPVP